MRLGARSPSEFYIKFLLSRLEYPGEDDAHDELFKHLDGLALDGMDTGYLRQLIDEMGPRPDEFEPANSYHKPSRTWLKNNRIFDMWHPTAPIRESQLILSDMFLREKLEPLLLSSMRPATIARKLRRFTSIALTNKGVVSYGHYFWNRGLLTQAQWVEYLSGHVGANPMRQSLLTSPDMVPQHLPWVIGIAGPSGTFDTAEAAARIARIAFKHAIELEHKAATVDTTISLRNSMVTIEKADKVMRRSDVALRDVLEKFQKFRMKTDRAKIIDVQQLTDGNFSHSGEGTDVDDESDF